MYQDGVFFRNNNWINPLDKKNTVFLSKHTVFYSGVTVTAWEMTQEQVENPLKFQPCVICHFTPKASTAEPACYLVL